MCSLVKDGKLCSTWFAAVSFEPGGVMWLIIDTRIMYARSIYTKIRGGWQWYKMIPMRSVKERKICRCSTDCCCSTAVSDGIISTNLVCYIRYILDGYDTSVDGTAASWCIHLEVQQYPILLYTEYVIQCNLRSVYRVATLPFIRCCCAVRPYHVWYVYIIHIICMYYSCIYYHMYFVIYEFGL